MTTPRKIETNRRNGAKSTGPTSPEGKAASSRNAWKHGLRAQYILYPDEDLADYLVHWHGLRQEREPKGPIEEFLVERMAIAMWQMWRTYYLEFELMKIAIGFSEFSLQLAERDANTPKDLKDLLNKAEGPVGSIAGFNTLAGAREVPALQLLFRYRAHAERAFYRALHELDRLQAARKNAGIGDAQSVG